MEQFLELFNPYPGNHYMVVSTGFDEISFELYRLIKQVDGEFSIAIYGKEQEIPKELDKATIKYIDDFSKPYRAMPRSNDVVLKDIYSIHKNKNMLIKIAYTSLANSAEIVLMEKKRGFGYRKNQRTSAKLRISRLKPLGYFR